MDLKKRAGLALALAAIFTTGWATVALADNVTSGDALTEAPPSDDPLVVTGGDDAPVLNLGGIDAEVETIIVDDPTTAGAPVELTLSSTSGGTLTLDASGNGELIQTKSGKPVDTVVAQVPVKVQGGEGKISKTLQLDTGATLDVEDGKLTVAKLNVKAAGNDIKIAGSTKDKTASLAVDDITIDSGTNVTITVGGTGGGILSAVRAALQGSMIFADPAFVAGEGPGSSVAISSFGTATSKSTAIDGVLVAGQNSTVTIGDTKTDLVDKAINDIGVKNWSAAGYSAAMAFVGPQTLDDTLGALYVNGTLTGATIGALATTPNTITFDNNSLAVFDLTDVGLVGGKDLGALSSVATGTTTSITTDSVDIGSAASDGTNNAGVYFHNAHVTGTAAGDGYIILDDVTTLNVGGTKVTAATDITGQDHWNNGNLHFSSKLLTGQWTLSGTDLVLQVTRDNSVAVRGLFPELSSGLAGMVDSLYSSATAGQQNDTYYDNGNTYNANTAGIAFVSRATDNEFIGETNPTEAAKILEGAAQIAVAAGVPALTNNVIAKVSGLVVDHNNLLNDTQPAYGNEPGAFGLWLNPFYGYSDVDGLESGRFENGYEINYGGAAFGLDYNVNEAFRLGLALNAGGGDSESQGDFNKTENDFDFFGVSLYGSYSNGAFGLTGDLGYTTVDNEVEQSVPAAMLMPGKLHSDMDSDALTVGLTGRYRFAAGENLNVTPHLGLRYTKVSTDDAEVKLSNDLKVFEVKTDDQNLFQIPLGVEFSSDIVTEGGWTVTPSADLGVLFSLGDTDVDSRARIWNTPFSGRTNSDTMDSTAFMGSLGVKAKADNGLSLGLDYGILASGDQTDHQFSGMLRFEF